MDNYYILTNRNQYYLHHALILVLEKENQQLYRLVVYHNGKLLTDRLYSNIRGAKIGFSKYHGKKGYKEDMAAQWDEIKGGDLTELSPPLPELPLKAGGHY